jgi:hypothetical protein
VQGNSGKIKQHWYECVPESVEASREGQITILGSQRVQTEKIPNNKLDIVNRNSEKATCMFIDVAISGHRTLIKT